MIVTPNTRGHYPKGYPKSGGTGFGYDMEALEKATDKPDLTLLRTAIEEARSDGRSYFRRNQNAWDWWQARWPGQTVDGRKWGDEAWPWPGGSDIRVRTVEKVIGQHRTLATFALRNMKVQAKANRPFAPANGGSSVSGSQLSGGQMAGGGTQQSESQKATTLLNWMIFTHMGAELHRELRLGISWRNGYGAAILCLDWDQQRWMDYITVNVAGLQDFINEPAVRAFMGEPGKIPIGEGLKITDLQDMIMDPAYEEDLAGLLREVSHKVLSLGQARGLLEKLRELRYVDVPIPYVFKNRPRLTALRPMVDVVFAAETDDLQRAPLIDRVEYVSSAILRDRIVTADYSSKFVEEALERRGPSGGTDLTWLQRTGVERAAGYGMRDAGSDFANDIELHHTYTLVHDRGVPVRFHTVFHMDVEAAAKHEPYGYEHGEACFHPQRFELAERPILSSQGIAEKAYGYQQALKHYLDAQADRSDMAMRPPIFTTAYEELQKFKAAYMPAAIIPLKRFDTIEKDKPPMWDPSSVQMIERVERMVEEEFAIFGANVDEELKKLRREEFVDDILAELKPVHQQMMKLMRELLPDEDEKGVMGELSRPFHISRKELRGEWEISATVDLRDMNEAALEKLAKVAGMILNLDSVGVTDKALIVKSLWERFDVSFADLAVRDQAVATNAEIQDEQKTFALIVGSGRPQPLPQGGNYALRMQTLQTELQQAMTTDPDFPKRIEAFPATMEVLQSRLQFFQRQMGQTENAMIGKTQVADPFTKKAPTLQDMGSALQ